MSRISALARPFTTTSPKPRPPRTSTSPFQCFLEVERKFPRLAVRQLTQHGGSPAFASLRKLPPQEIHDAYYDRADKLSSLGAWVRRRNGKWEAKIAMGGDYANSRFQELAGGGDVGAYVRGVLGGEQAREEDSFGLSQTAEFVTARETWVVDGEFHVVRDRMDFGHEVGEVELQQVLKGEHEMPSEEAKREAMQEMDERIVAFMDKYKWAFAPGEAKGKLTAYFERFK